MNHDKCQEMLHKIVSAIQGAPFPAVIDNELYTIWYEHIQRTAMECFEFLDELNPTEQKNIVDSLEKHF